jgi:predicted lipoprotein with Yx(FWY)xxD motif
MSGLARLWTKIGLGAAGAALVVTGATAATTASGAAKADAPKAPPASVTVQTRNGPNGAYLTDGQGKSLYLFVADTSKTSTCNDACAAQWPPLVTGGAVTAGSGVDASKLSTSNRQDNTKQATYNNHPLYYFIADTAPGQTNGQGVNAFGALWWTVNPTGDAITKGGSGGTPAPGGGITY